MYFCTDKHIAILKNSYIWKTIKLKTQLIINKDQKLFKVTKKPLNGMSSNKKRKLKAMQATQIALFKQIILDLSFFSCRKLKLVGVGFRVSFIKVSGLELLNFKLGYSHAIYFKIPKILNIFCIKHNKLVILGNSSIFLAQIVAIIRSYKIPEPYKGKGILYTSEKISLKEGKKL